MQGALQYLLIAESDFKTLQMHRSTKDVQYFLSVVYHNLDMTNERDAAAKRHEETERLQERLEKVVSDPETLEIFDLITTVGCALASR